MLNAFSPSSSLSMEMVAFKSSINKVADEKVDSILLMSLFTLISAKVELRFNPVSVLNLLSKIWILLIVDVESS